MGQITKIKYLILGGGLSGIGAARALINHDHLIIEKNNYLLGHANSEHFMEHFFDYGTHICHSKNNEWLEILNKKNVNFFQDSDVKNYDNGDWVDYPVQNNLRHINSKKADLALRQLENLQGKKPDLSNYLKWSKSVYGDFLTKKYYERFTHKYWRTNMSDMSTNWFSGRILPTNLELIREGHKSKPKSQAVFRSFSYPSTSGFKNFFSEFYKDINFKLNTEIVHIDPKNKVVESLDGTLFQYEKLISTLPLNEMPNLMNTPKDVCDAAKKLKYLNMISTAAVVPDYKNVKEYPHWFYIYDSKIEMSRVTNISRISNQENKGLALQFETFRRNDEDYDQIKLKKKIENQCKTFLGESINVKFKHFFAKYSYVLSLKDTNEVRAFLANYLDESGIHACGLYGTWEYMWSDKSYLSGKNLANKIL